MWEWDRLACRQIIGCGPRDREERGLCGAGHPCIRRLAAGEWKWCYPYATTLTTGGGWYASVKIHRVNFPVPMGLLHSKSSPSNVQSPHGIRGIESPTHTNPVSHQHTTGEVPLTHPPGLPAGRHRINRGADQNRFSNSSRRHSSDDRPASSPPEPADTSRRLWLHPGRVRSTRAAILMTDRLAATMAAATAVQRREPRSRDYASSLLPFNGLAAKRTTIFGLSPIQNLEKKLALQWSGTRPNSGVAVRLIYLFPFSIHPPRHSS
jgi:hypothetical protein